MVRGIVVTALVVLAAIVLDLLLGEPKRMHPLVGFGTWVRWLENKVYRGSQNSLFCRLIGIVSVLIVVTPVIMTVFFVHAFLSSQSVVADGVFSAALVYFCIAGRSLHEHAMAVYQALKHQDLALARQQVGKIVSRDTTGLDQSAVSKACVETVLENGSDAIFAPLFWYLLAGPTGIVAYRVVNTLDAMWGYKNSRYIYFGWAAARLDDLLNYLPARLCAFSYALCGHFSGAVKAWRVQAPACASPNAGPVMSAGAGALRLSVGGNASYHGTTVVKPILGYGAHAVFSDIPRALGLVRYSVLLWLLVIVVGGLLWQ